MENKRNNDKNLIIYRKPLFNFNILELYVKKLLIRKYFVSKTLYEKFIIKNIIYDDRNRLVSIFKDNLIMNDTSEILKRYYIYKESLIRLKKYYQFYSKYSKIFPNYIPLSQSKYIFKNIHKKQKLIDMQREAELFRFQLKSKTRNNKLNNNKIFNSKVYETLEKYSENLDSAIFDIHKYDLNDDSISKIEKIINSIDKYELLGNENEYNHENINNTNNLNIFSKFDKDMKTKNIIINNYYYNNSSLITKQSTIPSIFTQKQKFYMKEKLVSILNNNILISLNKNHKRKNYNHSNLTTLKNFITSFKEEKSKNNKKSNIILDDTNSFINNKHSSNYIEFISDTKRNNQNNLKTNNKKYFKVIPNLSKEYLLKNKNLIDSQNKLINFNLNINSHKIISNNKSSINNSIGINKNKKKKKFSLINNISFNKTNCLTDRTSHYFEQKKFNPKVKSNYYSGNINLKGIANDSSNKKYSDNKFKNNSEDKNKMVLIRLIKHIKSNKPKKSYNLNVCKFLFSTNLKYKNSNEKKLKEKLKIKTEREYSIIKKQSESKIFKIRNIIEDKIKKMKKNKNQFKSFNNQLFNESNNISKSFFDKENSEYISNKKLNLKNDKKIFENKIKSKLFIKQNNNTNNLLSKYLYSTINYSNKENKKVTNIYSIKKNIKKPEIFINHIDTINFNDIDISSNIKKPSVIKIKGIQIKNFNKILNTNKEKSHSNSSKKTERIKNKNTRKNFILKIPKNIDYNKRINSNEKKNKIKISKKKIIKKKSCKSNFKNYFSTKSFTERENPNKIKKRYNK